MCDLIDLKSPDGKTISGTKLASPLIPAPSRTSNDDENNPSGLSNTSVGLNIMKRNSLDNNPFDNAHHKTVEYVRKQEDPFETEHEKALMYEDCESKAAGCGACTVEFKDDFTPVKRRYSDVLKMNKTLDESVLNLELNITRKAEVARMSSMEDIKSLFQNCQKSDSTNKTALHLHNHRPIPKLLVDPTMLDSSILNQSAMNDSLTESSGSTNESLFKSSIDVNGKNNISDISRNPNFLFVAERVPKLVKHRRSLSQGDKMSPKKFREHRYHSIVDGLQIDQRKADGSFMSSAPSIVFEDIMNTAFLRALSANLSGFSNLSNISSIARSTSISSAFNSSNSSSAYSTRTANCAFIESYASDGLSKNSSDVVNAKIIGPRRRKSNESVSSIVKSPTQETQKDKNLNELISEYRKLQIKSSESSINDILSRTTSTTSESGAQDTKLICQKMEDKLIDVDVFKPEIKESSHSFRKKSISTSSSDSIFVDSDTIEKSIFLEAKSLAKTFEELASKTRSSSRSSDDLVNSRPHWNFDMLPPSDDEAPVDDLIKLQESSGKSDIEMLNDDEGNEKSTSSSEVKSAESLLKELDTNFRDPEKKIMASTLLLDLEKLVKSEDNLEAAELLKSLGQALGIKCDSNVDLLETCLSARNDLTKSPKRSEIRFGRNDNIINENIEQSCEDNIDIEASESFKQLNFSDDKNLQNNINVDGTISKSYKLPILVSEKSDDSQTEKMTGKPKNSSVEVHNDSIDVIKQPDQITNDQKMAVEILVALGKLLTGENKHPTMSTLLKNLSNASSLVSSNDRDTHVDVKTTVIETKRVATPSKSRAVSPRKSPAFSRTPNRKSLEFNKGKPTSDRIIRRSTSVIQTPTSTTSGVPRSSNMPLSSDKNKAHLQEGRKRFSSEPICDLSYVNGQISKREISLKPLAVSELARQDKPSSTVIGNVKNRFKKKTESEMASKKGPMKAVLPIGNMRRRGSSAKKEVALNGSVTPPKAKHDVSSAIVVTTSTPFPTVHLSVPPKKSPKSKPIASSTPDDVGTKYLRRSTSHIPRSPRQNTLSCNISPVTSKTKRLNDETSSQNNSMSSRTRKVETPVKSRQSSQLPKLSPMSGIKACSLKSNREQRRSEPLVQAFLPKHFGAPRSPRGSCGSDGSTSPLNNSNKPQSTVKPLNLISKLGRRKASVAEKENYAS